MEAWKQELYKKKGVVLIGPLSRWKKVAGGADTGRESTVVGVIRKLPIDELTSQDIVPKSIEGIETDVIEVGEIVVLGEKGGGGKHPRPAPKPDPDPSPEPDEPNPELRKGKWRPALGGVSIGHFNITAGTLGGVVVKKTTCHCKDCGHSWSK